MSERSVMGGYSLTPEQLEEVDRLLRSGRSDLRAATTLAADSAQDSDVIGFHAQQAVEKALKAVLVAAGAEIPFTHDLRFLIDLLRSHAVEMPELLAEADWLTPWAVAARYGASNASLDRSAAMAVANEAVVWAAAFVIDRNPHLPEQRPEPPEAAGS